MLGQCPCCLNVRDLDNVCSGCGKAVCFKCYDKCCQCTKLVCANCKYEIYKTKHYRCKDHVL